VRAIEARSGARRQKLISRGPPASPARPLRETCRVNAPAGRVRLRWGGADRSEPSGRRRRDARSASRSEPGRPGARDGHAQPAGGLEARGEQHADGGFRSMSSIGKRPAIGGGPRGRTSEAGRGRRSGGHLGGSRRTGGGGPKCRPPMCERASQLLLVRIPLCLACASLPAAEPGAASGIAGQGCSSPQPHLRDAQLGNAELPLAGSWVLSSPTRFTQVDSRKLKARAHHSLIPSGSRQVGWDGPRARSAGCMRAALRGGCGRRWGGLEFDRVWVGRLGHRAP
jgi:hypothetical protein